MPRKKFYRKRAILSKKQALRVCGHHNNSQNCRPLAPVLLQSVGQLTSYPYAHLYHFPNLNRHHNLDHPPAEPAIHGLHHGTRLAYGGASTSMNRLLTTVLLMKATHLTHSSGVVQIAYCTRYPNVVLSWKKLANRSRSQP